MHCEESYSYFTICKEELPEEQQKYTELIKTMRERYDSELKKFKEKAERLEKEEKERKEKEEKERKKSETKKESVEKDKRDKKQSGEKEKKIMLVCKAKIEDPKLTSRKLAGIYGLSHTSVADILKENLDRVKEEIEKGEENEQQETN